MTGGTARTQAALAASSGVLLTVSGTLTVPLGGEFRSFLKWKCDRLYPSISLLLNVPGGESTFFISALWGQPLFTLFPLGNLFLETFISP